jgi:hypothetical protein
VNPEEAPRGLAFFPYEVALSPRPGDAERRPGVPDHRREDPSGYYWPEDDGSLFVCGAHTAVAARLAAAARRRLGRATVVSAPANAVSSDGHRTRVRALVRDAAVALVPLARAERFDPLLIAEVEEVLAEGVPRIVPVAVDATALPRREELPPVIQPLVDRNGAVVTDEAALDALLDAIEPHVRVCFDRRREPHEWRAFFLEREELLIVIRADLAARRHTIRIIGERRGWNVWVGDRARPVPVEERRAGAQQFRIPDGDRDLPAQLMVDEPRSRLGHRLRRTSLAEPHYIRLVVDGVELLRG